MAQTSLFLEKLHLHESRLKSMFIIGDEFPDDDVGDIPDPFPLGERLPKIFDFVRCLTAPLYQLCRLSPTMHVHTSHFSYPMGFARDFDFYLRDDLALSIWAYLSTVELGAETFFDVPKSGLSFSVIAAKEKSTLSGDRRYIMEYGSVLWYWYGSFNGEVPTWPGEGVYHRTGLIETYPFLDHEHAVKRRDPWFEYHIHTLAWPENCKDLSYLVQKTFGRLYPGHRSFDPMDLQRKSEGNWLAWIEPRVGSWIWTYDLYQDERRAGQRSGDRLALDILLGGIHEWTGMANAWTEKDIPWLVDVLTRRTLFESAMLPGQRRITSYFTPEVAHAKKP